MGLVVYKCSSLLRSYSGECQPALNLSRSSISTHSLISLSISFMFDRQGAVND